MGKPQKWLAEQRPVMIEILGEIERGFPNPVDGNLTNLLRCLAQLFPDSTGNPWKIEHIRMAWWRWTTEEEGGSTPEVKTLALIVRHARNHGWLRNRLSDDCQKLEKRLIQSLGNVGRPQARVLENAWRPTAHVAAEGLNAFLEARIAKLAEAEDGKAWDQSFPAALVVQHEVRAMFKEVVEQILLSLGAPRSVTPTSEEGLVELFEGWPEVVLQIAAETSKVLTDFASDIRDGETSCLQSVAAKPGNSSTRKAMFSALTQESEEVDEAED